MAGAYCENYNTKKITNAEIETCLFVDLKIDKIGVIYMATIRFFSNYADSRQLMIRFQMSTENKNALKFDCTCDNNYDIAVIFNRSLAPINKGTFIILFLQEPSCSPNLPDYDFLTNMDLVFVHDKALFPGRENIMEHPSVMFYGDLVPVNFFLNRKIVKKKKISLILSSNNFLAGHSDRLQFLRHVLKSDLKVDIFGRGHFITDSRYKGELDYKFRGLMDYEYSICIENSQERNYVTEKFIDPVLCNTIPIYAGAPNVEEIYLKDGFHCLDLTNPKIIDVIKEIIEVKVGNQLYYNNFNKERYLNCYSIKGVLNAILG